MLGASGKTFGASKTFPEHPERLPELPKSFRRLRNTSGASGTPSGASGTTFGTSKTFPEHPERLPERPKRFWKHPERLWEGPERFRNSRKVSGASGKTSEAP